jgi:TonB family protein
MPTTLRIGVALLLVSLLPPRARAAVTNFEMEPAHLIHEVSPTAPAMRPGSEAEVVLTLQVDTQGHVTRVDVTQSAGVACPACDGAALEAARQFQFSPARVGGLAVAAEIRYRVRFVGPPGDDGKSAEHAYMGTPTIAGTVIARGDRTPQPGVRVFTGDGKQSTTTDALGHFVLDHLHDGPQMIHLRGIDIAPLDEEVVLDLALPVVHDFFVDAKPRYVARVRGRLVLSDPIEQTISADEIKHIAGTQGDTLKAAQNLPGVARPPFNGGLMAVWGSPPGDTRVYADGAYIPTLYHFGGVRSTVNASIVSSLTLLPGGYDVSHGRGLGGVVEMETREPRKDGIHGFVQLDLVDASGMIEGGIGKKFSVAAGFRVSILEFSLPSFLDPRTQFDPKYWDYQLKLHFELSSRDTLDFFFFGSDDTLDVELVDPTGGPYHQYHQDTFFHRGLVKYAHRFNSGATLTITPSVGIDQPYGLTTDVGNGNYYNTGQQVSYTLRAAYRARLGNVVRLDAGVDFEGAKYHLDARQNPMGLLREGDTGDFLGYTSPNPALGVLDEHLDVLANHTAPYVALTIAPFAQRLLIMPQLRLETMTFSGKSTQSPASFSSGFVMLEPRLAARVKASKRVAVLGSIGIFHQAPDLGDLSPVFGNPKLTPEMAVHYVAGVEVTATPTLHIEMQGFYKDLRNLPVRGVGLQEAPLIEGGFGHVYGGELLVRQELWKNFFGWISYTLMKSERKDRPGDPWRPFQYDQTHILTVLGSYRLPKGFTVGLRFRYATGNPYTPVSRAYYDVNSFAYVPVYGSPYSARLPSFNQLDLRVDKTFTFNHWRLGLYVDIQNLYNAASPEAATYSYDFKQTYYLNGLPFLPIVGIRGDF